MCPWPLPGDTAQRSAPAGSGPPAGGPEPAPQAAPHTPSNAPPLWPGRCSAKAGRGLRLRPSELESSLAQGGIPRGLPSLGAGCFTGGRPLPTRRVLSLLHTGPGRDHASPELHTRRALRTHGAAGQGAASLPGSLGRGLLSTPHAQPPCSKGPGSSAPFDNPSALETPSHKKRHVSALGHSGVSDPTQPPHIPASIDTEFHSPVLNSLLSASQHLLCRGGEPGGPVAKKSQETLPHQRQRALPPLHKCGEREARFQENGCDRSRKRCAALPEREKEGLM